MLHSIHIHAGLLVAAIPLQLLAQEPSFALPEARARAVRASPEVAAAREAVSVARGLERQAAAFLNPVLSYGREQTDGEIGTSTQDILAADQAIEWPAVRSARRGAARARRAAAEARLAFVESQVNYDVARAYAVAGAAARRARLADSVAHAFGMALAVSERRLREGDISGFAARRIRLERSRYAALRVEAALAQRTGRAELATLLADTTATDHLAAAGELPTVRSSPPTVDSLVALAWVQRGDLQASRLEIDAAIADARRAGHERLAPVTLTAGTKREELPGGDRMSGLVAGVALPLPLWDRRGGAVAAADAESRRRVADALALRRRVMREVREAAEAFGAAQEQVALLGDSVQSDATLALRAAQTAYAEGEISLLEWLDTVRAWQETEITIANLRAEVIVRAAALERAVGTPLFPELR